MTTKKERLVNERALLRRKVRDGDVIVQLKCPVCETWADLDDDQLHGRVSTDHSEFFYGDGQRCTLHVVRDWAADAEWEANKQKEDNASG